MSGKYALYKNSGAVRFNLIPPKINEKGFLADEGAVLVEISKGTGKDSNGNNVYDWENKVMFAIGIADLAILMENPWARLMHKHEKGGTTTTKIMGFQKLEPREEGQAPKIWLGYEQKDEQGNGRKLGVALTVGEHRVAMELLKASIPQILGWGHVGTSR